MKKLIFILTAFVFSCQNNADDKVEIEAKVENVKPKETNQTSVVPQITPGEYVEYHPNGAVKIKGVHNKNMQREGLWTSYYENGIKWSESYYSNGKRDGHSLTFFPNGGVRYLGEYKDDIKIGTWTFYDETGKVVKEEKY